MSSKRKRKRVERLKLSSWTKLSKVCMNSKCKKLLANNENQIELDGIHGKKIFRLCNHCFRLLRNVF